MTTNSSDHGLEEKCIWLLQLMLNSSAHAGQYRCKDEPLRELKQRHISNPFTVAVKTATSLKKT